MTEAEKSRIKSLAKIYETKITRYFSESFPGVNFNNILHEPFLFESALQSFSLIIVWLCDFFAKEY